VEPSFPVDAVPSPEELEESEPEGENDTPDASPRTPAPERLLKPVDSRDPRNSGTNTDTPQSEPARRLCQSA